MKIGILTMHRVLNYGSALQAFSLQHYLESLGHSVELIDYIFPNKGTVSFYQRCVQGAKDLLTQRYKKKLRFQKFYSDYYRCTEKQYMAPSSLEDADFDYDIIFTGSDQVWNPIHIKEDYSFFLPFVKKGIRKCSYSSSFSVDRLPVDIQPTVRSFLQTYDCISVREKSGQKIVRDLIGKDVSVTCDPTMLLDKEEWMNIASSVRPKIKSPYILLYVLSYAYNPYPEIDRIISRVQSELKLPLVSLDGVNDDYIKKNALIIRDAGPLEFLHLINNAAFVITTSFHGTAFSLNFGKPFFSVVRDRTGFDTRMVDLLERVNVDRAIPFTMNPDAVQVSMEDGFVCDIEGFRKESFSYLRQCLSL